MRIAQRWPAVLRLATTGALLTAAFSLLTFFDQLHRLLELFSHFRLQYLIASVFFATLFALLRNRNGALAMLALSLVNAAFIVPWYVAPSPVVANEATTITVLHANVYARNTQHRKLVDLIGAEQPDVVFVQEIEPLLEEALAVVHADYPFRHIVQRDDMFGIAVYSKVPLDKVVQHEGPPYGYPSLFVGMAVDGVPVTLVSTHPMPPLSRKSYEARNRQLQDIGEQVRETPRPVMLIGDLNISMWAHHYQLLVARTGLRNARDGFGLLPTWPAQLPPFVRIPIDHCLVSPEIQIQDIRIGPEIGSDHLPLIVTFSISSD